MRTNCLLFVMWMWWTRGGSVFWRRSHYYPGPHFLWAGRKGARVLVLSVVPPEPKTKRVLPPVLFKPVLKRGDS